MSIHAVLREGTVGIEQILATPPEYLATAAILDLLVSVPKLGPVKAARLLTSASVSKSKTIGGLSDRQRTHLIQLLSR